MLSPLQKGKRNTIMAKPDSFSHYCYGIYGGQPEYLEALSKHLSESYKDDVKSCSLCPTYGASFGYMLLMVHFLEKDDFLFVEDLTFGRVVDSATQYGLQVESVKCDDGGINVLELEQRLQECQKKSKHCTTEGKPFWGIIYLLTVLHNPKGTSYSPERSKAVVELARKHNVLVVTDDVYNMFQYNLEEGETQAARLVAFDKPSNVNFGNGHVVSNGSFSKFLFPALRLGWLETSPWIIKQLTGRADVISGGGYNSFNQSLAVAVLNNPKFPIFFDEISGIYSSRLKLACEYLQKNLPKEITFTPPKGSFFIWVRLPDTLNAEDLLKQCLEYGVLILPGQRFHGPSNYFRICTSTLPEQELLMALEVVCEETKQLVK